MIDPEQLQEYLNNLSKQQQELHRKQQELQEQIRADKLFDYFAKIISTQWDKSVAYTNLIIIAGYASYFALWTQVRDHLSPSHELLSALSMLVSASSFVTWEVYKMVHSAIDLRKQANMLSDGITKKNPDELLKRYEQYEAHAHRATITFTRLWIIQLCVSVPSAILAIAILGYGIVHGLIATYSEYPR